MTKPLIRPAQSGDLDALARMRTSLWPDGASEEHRREAEQLIGTGRSGMLPAEIFVAADDRGQLVGFIDVGLRSHADGCDVEQPVGFIEGWFVEEAERGHGLGRELMRAAEQWARLRECQEMASDALLDNEGSFRAHGAMGFEVVDRCVHFRKHL